jgi:hypothetical protein
MLYAFAFSWTTKKKQLTFCAFFFLSIACLFFLPYGKQSLKKKNGKKKEGIKRQHSKFYVERMNMSFKLKLHFI